MRKLLVASQKGGVGKTTTSINLAAAAAMAGVRVLLVDADPLSSISSTLNLAEHPRRQRLRQQNLDCPGVLVSDVISGLDVLSPYEGGGCSDAELDRLLAMFETASFQSAYGCLIVDTPPFMGANPGQLLKTCDEFVLVMRAEAMAYRTLPAFLELVGRQKTSDGNPAIKMRGILLTLPDGEQAGGRWEREIRGRFGTRILPDVVPYDELVSQAAATGQIVSQAHPPSPVAQAYHALVESIELTAEAGRPAAIASALSVLVNAAATARAPLSAVSPAVVAAPAAKVVVPAAEPMPAPQMPAVPVKTVPAAPIPARRPAGSPVVTAPATVAAVPAAARRLSPPAPIIRPSAVPDRQDLPEPVRRRMTPITPLKAVSPSAVAGPASPPPPPVHPDPAVSAPVVLRRPSDSTFPAHPGRLSAADTARPPVPKAVVTPAGTPEGWNPPASLIAVLVVIAIGLGVGLRFVELPDYLIPVLVGFGVATVVILGMLFLMPQYEEESPPANPSNPGEPRNAKSAASRLSGFARRVTAPSGRGAGDR